VPHQIAEIASWSRQPPEQKMPRRPAELHAQSFRQCGRILASFGQPRETGNINIRPLPRLNGLTEWLNFV